MFPTKINILMKQSSNLQQISLSCFDFQNKKCTFVVIKRLKYYEIIL